MPTKRTAAPPAPDPLADLRDETPAGLPEGAPQEPQDAPQGSVVPLVTPEDQDDAVAVQIAAWHADTVALGFLHGGGACGCRYLARLAVQAVLPLTPQGDAEEA